MIATDAAPQFNCVKKSDKYKIRCTLAVELLRSWALQVIYAYSIQLNLPGATYDKIMTTWNCHCMWDWCEHFAATDLIVQIQFKFYRFLQSPQQLEAKLASLKIPRELVHWSGQFIDLRVEFGKLMLPGSCLGRKRGGEWWMIIEWSDGLVLGRIKWCLSGLFFGSQNASWWLKSIVHWHHEVCKRIPRGSSLVIRDLWKKRRGKRTGAIPTL